MRQGSAFILRAQKYKTFKLHKHIILSLVLLNIFRFYESEEPYDGRISPRFCDRFRGGIPLYMLYNSSILVLPPIQSLQILPYSNLIQYENLMALPQ